MIAFVNDVISVVLMGFESPLRFVFLFATVCGLVEVLVQLQPSGKL